MDKKQVEATLKNLIAYRAHLMAVLADEFSRGVEAAIEKADRDIAKAEEALANF